MLFYITKGTREREGESERAKGERVKRVDLLVWIAMCVGVCVYVEYHEDVKPTNLSEPKLSDNDDNHDGNNRVI